MRRLTLRMRNFGLAFVGGANGNGVEAARIAKYRGNDATLRAIASENLTKPNIIAFIAELRREAESKASDRILSATETLVGITRIAQSDIADLFPDDLFLKAAKEQGVSRLIKTINFDKDTGRITKIEMYSAQTAFQDMGKYHKLFPTKIEISTSEVEETIKQAVEKHNLPNPETFSGEPVLESEM